MDVNLAKDLYVFELERRGQLAESANTMITGMALVAALLGFLLQARDVSTFAFDPFAIAMGLALAAFVYALHQLISFYRHVEYFAIPTAKALQGHYRALQEYFEKNPGLGTAKEDFDEYLIDKYSEATEINAVTNFARGSCINRGVGALAVAVLFGLTATTAAYIGGSLSTKKASSILTEWRV